MNMKKKMLLGISATVASLSLFSSAYADNHIVKSGDTLFRIATTYSVNVDNLKTENNLTNNTIYVGQSLYIPGTSKVAGEYTVVKGDTLYGIARSKGVSVDSLKTWNQLKDNTLKIGQKLIVSQPAAPKQPVAAAPVVAPPTVQPPVTVPQKAVTYTVKSGDTLFRIALNHGLSVDELKSMNQLNSNTIRTGQTLTVSHVSVDLFIWPSEGVVTSHYGMRNGKMHFGTDIAKTGTVAIQSVADGVVSKSYYSTSYGEVIFVVHTLNGKTYESVYSHLRSGSRAVKVGDTVKQGQFLGYMGATGQATGQHLHFELHEGRWDNAKSNSVNPLSLLPKK